MQSNELTQGYFRATAPVTPGPVGEFMRRYVANPGDAEAVEGLARQPEIVGLLRTTCVTHAGGRGHAPNVLPQRATANVNCRIFPGTTIASVQQTLQQVLAEPGITITYDASVTKEAPASPLRKDVMDAVAKAVHARFPKLPIVPTMSPGATDWPLLPGTGRAGLWSVRPVHPSGGRFRAWPQWNACRWIRSSPPWPSGRAWYATCRAKAGWPVGSLFTLCATEYDKRLSLAA